MKRIMLSLLTLLLIAPMAMFAQSKTEKFEVKGQCGMCEKRIEKAAKSVEGVTSADWNLETKMLVVTFDDTKTQLDNIQKAIAKAGHDNGKHKAPDEVYDKLAACCKYERSNAQMKKLVPNHL